MTSAFPPQAHNPHEWAAMHPDVDILVGSRPIPAEPTVGVVEQRGEAVNIETGVVTPPGEPLPSADAPRSDEDAPVDVNGDGQVDAYERATKADLVAQCEQRGLPTAGTKADLVRRLQEADAAKPPEGE
ncbi:MAG TPA: SAP domain-containing protein [Mycobacterium sp.]|nr:SAP domain-containing protein [Mycobacterium sp.]